MDPELANNFSKLELVEDENPDHNGMGNDDGIVDYQGDAQISSNCNLIVNYLPHDIDDLSLKGLFMEFGEIVMTKVVLDRTTKKSLGYGFVKFLREDDARMAINKLNGFTIDHKCLKVSVARPPSLEIRNCKLYITNLPKEYSEVEVINLFKEFGEIIECRVLKDRNLKSNKGVAFVQFDNKTQANAALSLNGCQLEGSTRGLVVKYAEDQHKKREMNRLQNLTSHNAMRYMDPMLLQQQGANGAAVTGNVYGAAHMDPHGGAPGMAHHGQQQNRNGAGPHGGNKHMMMNNQQPPFQQQAVSSYYASSLHHTQSGHSLAAPNIYANSPQMTQRHAYGQLANGSVSGGNAGMYYGNPNGQAGTNGSSPQAPLGSQAMQQLQIPPPPPIMSPYSAGLASPLLSNMLASPNQPGMYAQQAGYPQLAAMSGMPNPPSPLLGGGLYGGSQQGSPNSRKKGGRKTANGALQINVPGGADMYGNTWQQQAQGQQYVPPAGSPLISLHHIPSPMSAANSLGMLASAQAGAPPPGSPHIHHNMYHLGSPVTGGNVLQALNYPGQKQPYMQYATMQSMYAGVSPMAAAAVNGVYDNGSNSSATTAASTVDGSYSAASPVTLDVGNLPVNANPDMLREMFSQYGHVLSLDPVDSTGTSVDATTSPSAGATPASARFLVHLSAGSNDQAAVRALNGFTLAGTSSPLQVRRLH